MKMAVFRSNGSQLVVRQWAALRAWAHGLIAAGLLSTIGFAVVAVKLGGGVAWLLELPGGFLLLLGSLAFWKSGKNWVLDFGNGHLRQGRDTMPLESFAAVTTWMGLRWVRGDYWSGWKTEYWVGLLYAEEISRLLKMVDKLDQAKIALNEMDEKGRAQADKEVKKLRRLMERCRTFVETQSLDLGRHGSEAESWRVACLLAEKLQIPVVDCCGGDVRIMPPETLGMPLPDRLVANKVVLLRPGAAPENTESEEEGGRLSIRYRSKHADVSIGVVFVLSWLVLCGVGVPFYGGTRYSLVLAFIFAAALAWYLWRAFACRRHNLDVTAGEMVYRRGGRVRQRLSLGELELLRACESAGPSLRVIAGKKSFGIGLPVEVAEWLAQRVERFLVENRA